MKRYFTSALLGFIVFFPFEFFSSSSALAASLTPQEKRGREVYMKGVSAEGREITAVIGGGTVHVSAATLPCVSCHGSDGRGKPEGGVTPSNITWEALTKPYGVTHASGRKHPPYAERSVRRAIAEGLDTAGNNLLVAMPRYQMTHEEMADLIAYLKRVGQEKDPGLTEDEIRIGTILPMDGRLGRIAEAMRAVMAAYADEINEHGGIHNRRIEFKVSESGPLPRADETFAMVGAFMAGQEKDVASMIQKEGIPLVGPFTLFPQNGPAFNRYLFYVFSGLNEQARVLADFAAQKLQIQDSRVAVIFPQTETLAGVAKALEQQVERLGWPGLAKFPFPVNRLNAAALVEEAKRGGCQIVFFLGSGEEAKTLAEAAEKIEWFPNVFLPGSLAGKELFETARRFQAKVYLSYPSVPADLTRAGVQELRRLAVKYNLPQRHLAAQILAYSAVKILAEGLKRAGRDLSREKLIAALEELYRFETGLTPLITYGPNRRIGALGAYVVGVDWEQKRLLPVSGWLEPR